MKITIYLFKLKPTTGQKILVLYILWLFIIVHVFQDKIVKFIKNNIPTIETIDYFGDSCSGQYKNCQIMLYLCDHLKKYGIAATWSFFTTSHWKFACDGTGGTIKRETTKESIRRKYENQITNVDKLSEFCRELVKNIYYQIVRKTEVKEVRNQEE